MGTYLSVARTVDSRGRVIVRAANACAFPCGPTAPPRLYAVDPDTAATTTLIEDPGQPGLAAVLRSGHVVYSMGHGPDELGVVTPDGRVLWLDRDSSELVLGTPDGGSRTVVATGVPASSVAGNNTAQLADGRIAFSGGSLHLHAVMLGSHVRVRIGRLQRHVRLDLRARIPVQRRGRVRGVPWLCALRGS
jgi:hypothetical protein